MITNFKRWLHHLLPNYCLLCCDPSHSPLALCKACINDLPWRHGPSCQICALKLSQVSHCGQCIKQPPAFTQVIVPFDYQAPIQQFVYQLKFQHKLIYAYILGNLLADYIAQQPAIERPQALIPMPLHDSRLKQRGFNQSVILAKIVAKKLGIAYHANALIRHKKTQAQAQLKLAARLANVRHAFSTQQKPNYHSAAIIDDVLTTGNTAHQACLSLQQAGVSRVQVWCVARAQTRDEAP